MKANSKSYSARRKFIKQSTALTAGLGVLPHWALAQPSMVKKSAMGVAGSSYANRWRLGRTGNNKSGFENAFQMLQHCESIGAGGIQVGSGNWTQDFTGKVRDFREKKELYLEGSIRLPQSEADVDRFTQEAKYSMEAGATILRTACLSGRRYENFETGQAFEEFKAGSIKAVYRAIPVLEKFNLKLAIENHKDWRVEDLIALLKYFDHELLGVNLDTGNNISFLEDPMNVVESLAPFSFTTHLKDMGVQHYEDGFLLSEVPLGSGQLDLHKMVSVCLSHNPDIKFNLEMITRNPLKVPCFTDKYWATFEQLPARNLMGAVKWVRDHQSESGLPSVEGMTDEQKIQYEERNILDSFSYATQELKLIQ